MTWEQVRQDYNEAIRRRAAKEHELLLAGREKRERPNQPDTTPKAPSSLEEFRNAFLAMKRKEWKRDRTPLDEYTIRAYEGLVQDFIYITKCQYPGDVTGEVSMTGCWCWKTATLGRTARSTSPPHPGALTTCYGRLTAVHDAAEVTLYLCRKVGNLFVPESGLFYSCRKAAIGSTRMARRAGM